MFYTYILRSEKDSSRYVGSTQNLKLRIEKHNDGEVIYSAKKRPWKLIWYWALLTKNKAIDFEMYLNKVPDLHLLENICYKSREHIGINLRQLGGRFLISR